MYTFVINTHKYTGTWRHAYSNSSRGNTGPEAWTGPLKPWRPHLVHPLRSVKERTRSLVKGGTSQVDSKGTYVVASVDHKWVCPYLLSRLKTASAALHAIKRRCLLVLLGDTSGLKCVRTNRIEFTWCCQLRRQNVKNRLIREKIRTNRLQVRWASRHEQQLRGTLAKIDGVG